MKDLIKYKEKHGDCNVPWSYKDRELFTWVCLQRQQYKFRQDKKDSDMTLKRIKRLDDIGFVWNAQDYQWNTKFQEFAEIQKTTGWNNDNKKRSLINWAHSQRSQYLRLLNGKQSRLTTNRKKLLDGVNFQQFAPIRINNKAKGNWEHFFTLLEQYLKANSTLSKGEIKLIPNSALKKWFIYQVRLYNLYKKSGKTKLLTSDQIAALESINISTVQPYHYDPMFYSLTKFKIQHGSSYCPYTVDPKLHLWQKQISRKYHKNSSSLYINEIHALKHFFAISDSKEWFSMLYQCEEYLNKVAKAAKRSVSQLTEQRHDYELLEWMQKQTTLFDRSPDKFSVEEVCMLNDIGLINVPPNYYDNNEAIDKSKKARSEKEDTNLAYSIAAKMKLDFAAQNTPKINEDAYWEIMFAQYQEYKQGLLGTSVKNTNNFDDSVQQNISNSATLKNNPELVAWQSEQRKEFILYKQGLASKLNSERIEKMELFGFAWDIEEEVWMRKYRELADYTKKTGHCFVPHWYPSNPSLGHWVHAQLKQMQLWKQRRKGSITAEEKDNDEFKESDDGISNEIKESESKLTKERVRLLEEVGLFTEIGRDRKAN